jgi:3-oxoacyl-[acyl-carrier-protein] synthase II
MSARRVVITGLGVVAPNGTGSAEFWQALVSGQNAVGPITRFDATPYATRFAGEVKNFVPHPQIPLPHLAHMDRAYQMGVSAALQAVHDAQLTPEQTDVARWGVYMGLAVAGVDSYEKDFRCVPETSVASIQSQWYQGWFPSACSGYISLVLGLRGSSQVVSTGCSSSVDALGMAFAAIREGWEDIAIAGGTEAPITPAAPSINIGMDSFSRKEGGWLFSNYWITLWLAGRIFTPKCGVMGQPRMPIT